MLGVGRLAMPIACFSERACRLAPCLRTVCEHGPMPSHDVRTTANASAPSTTIATTSSSLCHWTRDTTHIDDLRIEAVRPLSAPTLLMEALPGSEVTRALV